MRGLDNLGTRHGEAADVADDQVVGAAGDDAHATEAAVGAADQHQHRNAGSARVEERAHDLRDRDQSGIGFVQAHAARFGQQHHGLGPVAQGASEQTHQLGAMHLADAATHELALLRSDKYAARVQSRFADRHAVVEGRRHSQLRQVRTHHPLRRRQPLVEAAGIEERCNAFARRALGEADAVHRAAAHGSAAAACARRRLTTAGVAPMSWMATATPAKGCWA